MNKIKRIMAVMLALVMVLAIAPAQSAWAEGEQHENQQPGEGRPGEPQQGEQPEPARGIELRVEGDAADPDTLAELVMVSLDNGANYKSLKELASEADSKVRKNGCSYEFDSAVTSIMAYLTDEAEAGSYMLQTSVKIGKSNAVKINAGQTFIQIDKVRYTVTWAYDAKRHGEDAYLEHGTAKIIKVGDKTDFTDWDIYGSNPGNKDGGNLVVEPGQQVTVELVPDYGYQLDSVSLNGNTLAPQDEKSTFTFTMPKTNVHFKGAFVKAADVTDISSAAVGKIEISDGDNAAASGNLKIDVSDSASDTTKANEQIAATDGVKKEVVANLDISLQNIVSKGTNMQEISADNYWVNDITEFEKPIRLDVAIKDFDKDSEYSVVREHNGSYDVLDATVSDGKISFETNKFSTYVIVKKTIDEEAMNTRVEAYWKSIEEYWAPTELFWNSVTDCFGDEELGKTGAVTTYLETKSTDEKTVNNLYLAAKAATDKAGEAYDAVTPDKLAANAENVKKAYEAVKKLPIDKQLAEDIESSYKESAGSVEQLKGEIAGAMEDVKAVLLSPSFILYANMSDVYGKQLDSFDKALSAFHGDEEKNISGSRRNYYEAIKNQTNIITAYDTAVSDRNAIVESYADLAKTYELLKKYYNAFSKEEKEKEGVTDEYNGYTGCYNEARDIIAELESIDKPQLDAKTAAILETITGLTDKEIDAIYSGMNTSITKKVEAFTPNDADKKLIDTAKNEYTVGAYLDITMMLNIKDADSKAIIEKNITKLSKPVDILYKLSDDLLNKDNTKVRSYVIIRVHDGVADIITPQFNEADGTLTFATDRFSTYAVAYKDKSDSKNAAKDVKKSNESKKTEKAKSAKTSDNMQADLMLIVFIIGAAAIVVSLRRKRS